MENVDKREKVWRGDWRGELVPEPPLEEIYQKYSNEEQKLHACADYYVNCGVDSSWERLARILYLEEETTALEKVRSYLNPRGGLLQWVWSVVEHSTNPF